MQLPSIDLDKVGKLPPIPAKPAAPPPLQRSAAAKPEPVRASEEQGSIIVDLPELELHEEEEQGMIPLDLPRAKQEPVELPELELSPEPVIALPQGQAPLLLDVTPQSLRIETVSGFTEVIIERNAAIPVEQSRMFTTSKDFQEVVRARVCQGESRKLVENQELGAIELTGLRPGPRGKTAIEVTFVLDADGTLQVSAKDSQTGTKQIIRINLVGAVEDDEILRMQERQAALVG